MKKVLYILGLLDDKDVDWLVGTGRKQKMKAGEALVREGQPSSHLFVIINGDVQVSVKGRVVAQIGQGEVLGEISLLDSRPPSATVTASVDTTVLAVSFDTLKAKLSRDTGFASRLYQALGVFLAQRLRAINLQLIAGPDAKVQMSDEDENPDEIDPEVLEKITLAGSRFKWIMDKLAAAP